jgi:ADP-heptose:LPS heptosyltransferase
MTLFKRIEFGIKAVFFAVFKIILRKGNALSKIDAGSMEHILILRPDRIGDTVCSFPLIDHLLKNFPRMKMSIFASPKNISLIKTDPRFEKIFIYRRNILRDIKEVIKVRKQRYDCIIDLMADDSVTTLFISQFCSRRSLRIGVRKDRFSRYYDYNYHPGADCQDHMIDINLNLLPAFGLDKNDAYAFAPPYVDEKAETKAIKLFDKLEIDSTNDFVIGMNLSARGDNREWGLEKSKLFLDRIIAECGNVKVILITAPNERAKSDRLKTMLNNRVYQIPPNSSLIEVTAIIARLDILISPDTSLVHIARSLKKPVVGLYPEYRKVYRQWMPYRQPDGLVLSYEGDTVFGIQVDEVYNTFIGLLKNNGLLNRKEINTSTEQNKSKKLG